MTDRILLEEALRNAMSYQGYLLERDPDAEPTRHESDGYMVLRRTEVVLGPKFSAALEDVAAWAKRTGVGQPHLWHGNRTLPPEDE
jgi:hypothetical protein